MGGDVVQSQGQVIHKRGAFAFTPTGVNVEGDPRPEDFDEALAFAMRCESGAQWWIGDVLRLKHKTHEQLDVETDYASETLRKYEHIATCVEPGNRFPGLSFRHHMAVAPLPKRQQQRWLAKASKQNLSVAKLRRELADDKATKELTSNPLPRGTYDVIYADPPWRYEFSVSDSRKIENQYPTMETDQICGMDIRPITAPNCVLFLWATSPKLTEAMRVIDAWGFSYKTCMIWHKDKIGMGYYARQQHELLLISTSGTPSPPPESARPPSVVAGDREEHSRKPTVFYELIESMYPEAERVELFCRTPRAGWGVWGNQI